MTSPEVTLPQLETILTTVGGGYLRNPLREKHVTCADCTTPVNGFRLCYTCKGHHGISGLADATAFLTYAVAAQNSGRMMRGYKARPPVAEHRRVVGLMLRLALCGHTTCAEALGGGPVTHWVIVPSLPAKSHPHPLRSLVDGYAKGSEARLTAALSVKNPRAVNADHFSCDISLPDDAHVLLVDDTWTTGGHAQSAALALHKAGAARVSVLVVARWLKEDFGGNRGFIADLGTRDYDPRICPWTSAACPSRNLPGPALQSVSCQSLVLAGSTLMAPGRSPWLPSPSPLSA